MATGGTILFDTRDQNLGGGNTSNKQMLRVLARGLSLPPLEPVPDGHVLTKSFYLLVDFPGRWDGGLLWVERGGSAERDQVSRVITGSNNWAAAWGCGSHWPASIRSGAGGRSAARGGVSVWCEFSDVCNDR